MAHRRLDFLIAGVQKAGTTALHHFLHQHPDIGFSKQKELHFFDNENREWNRSDYTDLHRHFMNFQSRQAIGEATPIYTFWPNSMERICRYNKNMKIIVLLRDPVMRAYSHWRMEISRNNETLSFSQAIKEGQSRVDEPSPNQLNRRIYSYIDRGRYAAQLFRLFDLFPTHQVLLLKQHDMLTQHRATLDKACSFLGVSRFVKYPSKERVFSHESAFSQKPSHDDILFLRRIFEREEEILAERFNLVLPREC